MCQEVSQCYDDVNICLWTNGSVLTQSAAQTACQRRNSFLPRVNNSSIQSKWQPFVLLQDSCWADIIEAFGSMLHQFVVSVACSGTGLTVDD